MNIISKKSMAKINLGLDVTGVLPNGYHTVKMIMQTVSIYDSLTFEKRKKPGIILRTNLPYLPVNEKNIVYKCIKLFFEEFSISGGIFCSISKRIPVTAGMAGGSGNAAATLLALNELYGTDLPESKLLELGLKLGADVPYCIKGKTALAEGIGEILTPLPVPPKAKVLIVKPPFSVSTAEVYKNLKIDNETHHPDIDSCIEALHEGSIKKLASRMENILETVTIELHPEIGRIKEKMLELGADGSLMSGSGPTVFGLFEDENAAAMAFDTFKSMERYQKNTYLCDFT